jgi:hypothetical protein
LFGNRADTRNPPNDIIAKMVRDGLIFINTHCAVGMNARKLRIPDPYSQLSDLTR